VLARAEGFILKRTPYGENSAVLRVFTRESGLVSFMIHGLRKAKGGGSAALTQVMNRVEIRYYESTSGTLHKVKEMQLHADARDAGSDLLRMQCLLFSTEILHLLLREDSPEPGLYDVCAEVHSYPADAAFWKLFPSWFLLQTLAQQGSLPDFDQVDDASGFDPVRGRMARPDEAIAGDKLLPPAGCRYAMQLYSLKAAGLSDAGPCPVPSRLLFDSLLEHTRLHLLDGKQVRSVEIIRDVLHS
jgi:DNA repair protein RecO (recombination protein O)